MIITCINKAPILLIMYPTTWLLIKTHEFMKEDIEVLTYVDSIYRKEQDE